MNEKKLALAFKNFVQKVFLPAFKRTDAQSLEWFKFSRMLTSDNINVDQLAYYVDSINNTPVSLPNFPPTGLEKKEIPFMRKKVGEDPGPSHTEMAFNPSKTFGGQRARMMFMKGETQEPAEKKQGYNTFGVGSRADDANKRTFNSVTGQTILPGLQKLCKQFLQNQQRIESILTQQKSPPLKYQ